MKDRAILVTEVDQALVILPVDDIRLVRQDGEGAEISTTIFMHSGSSHVVIESMEKIQEMLVLSGVSLVMDEGEGS